MILYVAVPDRPVRQKVSLWPGDEDAFCDCADRIEPCVHVAAAIAALRTGLALAAGSPSPRRGIHYRLVRKEEDLLFERVLDGEVYRQSLVSLVGALESGRAPGPPIAAGREDFAIDEIVAGSEGKPFSRALWLRLFPVLRDLAESRADGITIDGKRVEIGSPLPEYRAQIRPERGGLRLTILAPDGITESFPSGPVLVGSVLRVFEEGGFTSAERERIGADGRWYAPSDVPKFVTEILPALKARMPVDELGGDGNAAIPRANDEPPKIVLRMESVEADVLNIVPTIEYPSKFALKDPVAEARLARRLETEFRMVPGRRTRVRGLAALELISGIEFDSSIEARGTGPDAFRIEAEMIPAFAASIDDFTLRFGTANGKSAEPARVLEAWRRGDAFVSLLEGGFAPLPSDWLDRFAPSLERLFALRETGRGKLPPYARPALADLSSEAGARLEPSLRSLRDRLGGAEGIPEATLPEGLTADLRAYQRAGVNWLRFLVDGEMGALLADDMGLGKTLQTIAVLRGRSLVVAPKSVLHAWREQLARFRPNLRVAMYEGSGRRLDPSADVTLVTYGVLRLDETALGSAVWDLAVLDEAQTIKNPDSQVARAAHRLRAKARITLSGTPVENRLDDLWSQFHFLNPGLLGTRAEFTREFAEPIARGDARTTERFRRRIRPFILRRLKAAVAPELPARTEVVRTCELGPEERALYDGLLVATRRDVAAKLAEGAAPMTALELLLRLRQACCHPSLVPGQRAPSSAKLELLAESLEKSLALGHRALVFSQWTSYLDLIEERLRADGITYGRLDGATANRDEVVRTFQSPDGPSVLLLSLKAGGVGLTLTAADHVYLMDTWWNPAVEEQAADRAHRIGQENPVLITRLITEATVEEKILVLQARKRALSDAVLSGEIASATIRPEDVLALLED